MPWTKCTTIIYVRVSVGPSTKALRARMGDAPISNDRSNWTDWTMMVAKIAITPLFGPSKNPNFSLVFLETGGPIGSRQLWCVGDGKVQEVSD